MSHRDDCPSEYEARRQGRRDYENNGYVRYSTPYDECDEAREAYMRGQRAAEHVAEEEAAERRAQERLSYERDCAEREYFEQQEANEIARGYDEYCDEQEKAYSEHIAQLEAERKDNPNA